jgi:hypothetical protein
LDEGNAGGTSAQLGKLTDKDTVLLADFTNNTDDESSMSGFELKLALPTRIFCSYGKMPTPMSPGERA